jgi:LysR family transcriptional activator of glutamate synthase operon
MEIRQLRYLVALAEAQHFTKAAARVNVAQPALSRQIGKLEAELGVPLVDRTSRRVVLTDAGARLADRARRVLGELDAARAEAQELRALVRGRVSLGVTTTPGGVDVAALLAAFHRRHPGVELGVREDLSVALAHDLRADELDAALVTAVGERHRRQLAMVRVGDEPLRLCVGPRHPLAGRRTVRMADLRAEAFVAFHPGATIRGLVERAAARAGFEPRVAFEVGDVARSLAIVGEGLGVSVLPRSQAERPDAGVVALPLRDRDLRHELFLAWRAGREASPAARAFLALARERLEDPPAAR